VKRLDASCLLPVLQSHLRASETDILAAPALFRAVYKYVV
jgi:hypothetical protein